jgi:hypothetical protein
MPAAIMMDHRWFLNRHSLVAGSAANVTTGFETAQAGTP